MNALLCCSSPGRWIRDRHMNRPTKSLRRQTSWSRSSANTSQVRSTRSLPLQQIIVPLLGVRLALPCCWGGWALLDGHADSFPPPSLHSNSTGRLNRGTLQQSEEGHRGPFWSLHLDPFLREVLSPQFSGPRSLSYLCRPTCTVGFLPLHVWCHDCKCV